MPVPASKRSAFLARLVVGNAEQRLVLAARSVLAPEGAGLLRALGHVFIRIDAADECIEALVHARQRQVDVEAEARVEAVELIPEQARARRCR